MEVSSHLARAMTTPGAAVDSFETLISTFKAGPGTRRNPEMGRP